MQKKPASNLLVLFILAITMVVPAQADAFDAGTNDTARLDFFTQRLAKRGETPGNLDGVVYVLCGAEGAGPTKIGVSHEKGFRSRNKTWTKKGSGGPAFERVTRRVVRNLTRAEAWVVERNSHEYLKKRGLWLDPKSNPNKSTEVFNVSCGEALLVVKRQARIIRALRSDTEKERARKYTSQNPPAAKPDDATDLRRNPCRKTAGISKGVRSTNRLLRIYRISSTLYCKLTN